MTLLIRGLAEANVITKGQARGVMDTLAAFAVQEMKKDSLFVIPCIRRVDSKARIGRNPATSESIKIAAKKIVKFRVPTAAKEAMMPSKARKA